MPLLLPREPHVVPLTNGTTGELALVSMHPGVDINDPACGVFKQKMVLIGDNAPSAKDAPIELKENTK
jgi:hypothetical protein